MAQRVFLGKSILLAKSAAAALAQFRESEKLSDLGQILLVLPGELARKNVQRELLECFPNGLLLPQMLTPHQLLHYGREEQPRIPAVLDEILWGEVLTHAIARKEQFRQVFPGGKVPSDPFAASKALRTFRDELNANGFSIAEAAPHLGSRGAELARLEELYLQHLAENNFTDPSTADRQAAADVAAFAGISRIILAGLPDLPRILKEKLARIDREYPGMIEIWIGDDGSAADDYDQWGVPFAEIWQDKSLEIPLENIHLALDPTDAARQAMLLSGDPAFFAPENCTVVLSDPALYPDFAREFSRLQLDGKAITVADPSGMPFGKLRLARLMNLLLPVLEEPDSFPAALELFREEDFLSAAADSGKTDHLLYLLDDFQLEFTPDSRKIMAYKAVGKYAPLLELDRLLEWISEQFAALSVPEFLRKVFTRIFRRSEVEPCCGVSFQRECDLFNEQLRILEGLPEKVTAYPGKIKLLEIFFRSCRDLSVPTVMAENALTFEGRLEMPFLTAKRVIFCGMNENYFPDKIDLTPYLTDTLRREIGMRSNRETLARSLCHLFSAVSAREAEDFQMIVLKKDSKGAALAPSRILFNGSTLPENELLDRCGKLFNDPAAPPEISAAQQNKIFRLKPQLKFRTTDDGEMSLSVTDLDEYLRDPFFFFWKRVLKSDEVDYGSIEPDSRVGGSLSHQAFEALGCQRFPTLQQLRDRLLSAFDLVLAERYGELPAMVKIYADNMKQRLYHAAELLYNEQVQGFETLAVEYSFGGEEVNQLPFAGAVFKGKIDRIEYNRTLKIIRIVDIKSGNVSNVVDEHCTKNLVFKRLQLPLYALLLSRDPYFKEHLCPEIDQCQIECAYLHLARTVSGIAMHVWQYDPPDDDRGLRSILPLAEEETRRIIGEIRGFSQQKLYSDPEKLTHPLLQPDADTALTGICWKGRREDEDAFRLRNILTVIPREKLPMPAVHIPSAAGTTRCCYCPLHQSGCQCFHGDCSDCKCFNGFKAFNIITASAGTGKTYSLASRYLQLLNFGVKPETILAITFTRKATGEILDRIVKRICDMIREPEKNGNFCRRIDREKLFGHLRMLLASGEKEPQISTIDSFFMRLLKALAPELGIWGEISMIDEKDLRPMQETLRAWIHSISDDRQLNTLRELLKDANASEDKNFFTTLLQLIKEVYPCYLQKLERGEGGSCPQMENFPWRPKSSDVMPEELCLETEAALREWSERPCALDMISQRSLPALLRRMRVLSEELGRSRNGSLFGRLEKDTRDLFAELNKNPQGWCDAPDKAELFYTGRQLPARVAAVFRRSMRHIRALSCLQMVHKNHAVLELMKNFDRHYSKLVRNVGKLTFNDPPALLCHLDPETRETILGSEDHSLEMRLDAQISHYMFDEFQDTSDIQFTSFLPLLKELFSQPEGDRFRSFFCVGDIKQSIYQWRDGNPALFDFLTAQLEYTVNGQYDPRGALSCSYRSSQVIMDTVNGVFLEPYSGKIPGFEAARKQMKYLPHYSGVELEGHAAVIEVPQAENYSIHAKARIITEILKEMSPFRRGLTVGVLVRTNASAQLLADELRLYGNFPVSIEGKISPAQSMTFNVFKELLTLAAHPGDREAANFLDNLTLSEENEEPELFGRENIALKMGFDPVLPLSAALRREIFTNGIAAAVKRFADAFAGEVTAQERRCLEIVQRIADNFTGSIDEFLRQMQNAGENGSAVKGTVQIMTYHKSKGLEFDVVFMPDCGNHGGSSTKLIPEFENIVMDHAEYGAALPRPKWASYLPVREIAENIPPFYSYSMECSAAESFEKCCNLYVAMTRAKHALYMLLSCGKSTTTLAPDMLLKERLSSYGAQKNDWEWCRNFSTAEYPVSLYFSHGDRLWYGKFHALEKNVKKAEKFSFPAYVPPQTALVRTASGTEGVRRRVPGERFAPASGREYGTMIHELFARLEWVDDDFDENLCAAGLPPEVGEVFTSAMAKGSAVRELLTRKEEEAEVWLERRFLVKNPAGEIVPGAFDRVVVRKENGEAVGAEIIDYKSDRLPRSEDFSIYFPQLESYRQSLAILLVLPEENIRCKICALRLKEVIELN